MILWVDDNDELRRAVAEHLTAAGHRVVQAGSAEQAVECLERETEAPGLLLTDLRLPGRTGLQLAETLRFRVPVLPVLLVTSHATSADLDAWTGDARFHVLHKPFEMAELESAVSALLAGQTLPSRSLDRPLRFHQNPVSDVIRSTRVSRSPRWLRLALATVVALLILGGAWSWIAPGDAPPELPEAPKADDVVRGGAIQTLSPFGPVASAPSAFRWQAAANAARYRLQVEDVAGAVLWQGETAAVELASPSELTDRLMPLAAYYWRVEAFDAAETPVAASDPVRFRIVEPEERSSP